MAQLLLGDGNAATVEVFVGMEKGSGDIVRVPVVAAGIEIEDGDVASVGHKEVVEVEVCMDQAVIFGTFVTLSK